MGARRPAFALMLVILLVGAVFAMTLYSGVTLRLAMVETSAVAAQQSDLRSAQGAASVVLRGLSARADDATQEQGTNPSRGGPDDRQEPDRVELPPIVRQLLEAAGRQIEEEAERDLRDRPPAVPADGAGSGDAVGVRNARAMLRELGLPAGAIEIRMEGKRCVVELADGGGQLNINLADERAIESYLRLKGLEALLAQRVTHQILDWRDEDRLPRSMGAEAAEYRRLGIVPRDGPLETLDELLMLPAMTRELYELIRHDLCLVGDGKVHLGSASAEVLRAAGGLTESQVREVLEQRERGPLDRERIGRLLGLQGGVSERVRLDPSPIIRVRVTVLGERESEGARVFEGIATAGNRGVTGLGLRPVWR